MQLWNDPNIRILDQVVKWAQARRRAVTIISQIYLLVYDQILDAFGAMYTSRIVSGFLFFWRMESDHILCLQIVKCKEIVHISILTRMHHGYNLTTFPHVVRQFNPTLLNKVFVLFHIIWP